MPTPVEIKYINAFFDNNQRILSEVYFALKEPFMKYISSRFSGISDYAEDIYQESFIRLQQNILHYRLTTESLTTPLQIYLQRIGHNVGMEYVRDSKLIPLSRLHVSNNDEDEENVSAQNLLTLIPEREDENKVRVEQREKLIREQVMLMKQPCAPLLLGYYWENKSMRQLADEMDYSSEDVAKNQKARCMKKLKVFVIATLKKHGYEYRTT